MPTKTKNILICPLDWGLGHATRCVPIIKMLIDKGANVTIGADNRPLAFLKEEFPNLPFVKFPGYNIRYPENRSMVLKMLISFPKILKKLREEHIFLKKIISDYSIDIVISDNRFGLWNKKTKCIYITHQLNIKCPSWLRIFEYVLFKINKYFIDKYDECWIPDKENLNISGELTRNYKSFKNIHYIGLLSRFYQNINTSESKPKYDVICILSGPEPQRTIFENIILKQIRKNNIIRILIVRGLTESSASEKLQENVLFTDHLETDTLFQAISEADIIICRPGYTSIMDIITIGKKAIFVPTPGQTEQEYLAEYYKNRGWFYSINQKKFNLFRSLEKSKFYPGWKAKYDNEDLADRVNFWLD
ncbi:MAG: UDP-N-acetylglucosamine--N-acetylmuramyl-(pentapeptide) pyrophosphoryl-undecaprenol N-acetylglucosamine transferase [Bacteroidetes bacterium]|nr:UDP-N-acetylglucosamine--N-acetylmuramyl-(pentapeptide) pyrophosphoryl-undecaprenol N-acetylglucosamine transferase [Bacteroidota bacterium]